MEKVIKVWLLFGDLIEMVAYVGPNECAGSMKV